MTSCIDSSAASRTRSIDRPSRHRSPRKPTRSISFNSSQDTSDSTASPSVDSSQHMVGFPLDQEVEPHPEVGQASTYGTYINDDDSVSLDGLNDAVSELRVSSNHPSTSAGSTGSSMPPLESFCQGSFASWSRTSLELSLNMDDILNRSAVLQPPNQNNSGTSNELHPVLDPKPSGAQHQEKRWGKQSARDSMPSLPCNRS